MANTDLPHTDRRTRVDLIDGFLGAGKTTFIKRYTQYLKEQGISYIVLENEFGAAGVDARLLDDDNILEVIRNGELASYRVDNCMALCLFS